MDQSTPQQPSRKKTILSLTVLVVLTGIVFWIFQRHWAEISAALAQLRFWRNSETIPTTADSMWADLTQMV